MGDMGPAIGMFDLVPMIIGMIIFVIPAWVIASKTGRHGALSLIIFIPFIGGLVYLAVLAFGRWPAVDGEG